MTDEPTPESQPEGQRIPWNTPDPAPQPDAQPEAVSGPWLEAEASPRRDAQPAPASGEAAQPGPPPAGPPATQPAGRAISPLWSLLLIPVALLVVLTIHLAPIPAERAPKPAATRATSGSKAPAPAAGIEVAEEPASLPTSESNPNLPDLSSPREPRAIESEWTTYKLATQESVDNGKPVMLDFNAEWCGPCRRLKQQVFQDEELGRLVRKAVIPVSIVDRSREDGSNPPEVEDLQRRFGVDAFPTLVVFMPATGRAIRVTGYGDAGATVQWIAQAAQSVR